MKLSNRAYPIFDLLKNETLYLLNKDKESFDHSVFPKLFETQDFLNNPIVNALKNVSVVRKPFQEAVIKSAKSLIDNFTLLDEIGDEIGIFLSGESVHLYKIKTETTHQYYEYFLFSKSIGCLVFAYTSKRELGKREEYGKHWQSSITKSAISYEYHLVEDANLPRLILLFKNFAEIETRLVKGNSKGKDTSGEKIVNETGVDVTVLDCTWFTNIVRSEGFNVSGHFRLQPFGQGRKDRRLQWINGFEKHGYTRKASKLIAP